MARPAVEALGLGELTAGGFVPGGVAGGLVPVGFGAAVGGAVAGPVGCGAVGAPMTSTCRKRSSAVCLTSESSSSLRPGIEMTMLRLVPLPWAAISASPMPRASTRRRMISTARSTFSLVTLPVAASAGAAAA
jgi:hypothetical protein